MARERKNAHGAKPPAISKQAPGPARQIGGSEKAAADADLSSGNAQAGASAGRPDWDAAGLLRLMWECWNEIFGKTLGRAKRGMASELMAIRNQWAQHKPFTTDDARAFALFA